MDENKNNVPKEQNNSPDNVKVYEDYELFDLDALRKSNQPAKTAQPSQSAQQSPEQKKPTSSSANKPGIAPSTPRQPQQTKSAPKKDRVTDVKPDKVVFDSASEAKRIPKSQKPQKERKMKPIRPQEEKTRGANPVLVLSKALIYIAAVLLISCLCAYYIIVIANDVFAFVKADAQIEVTIPEYATIDQIADELHDKQVIRFPKIFVLYTMIRGNDPGEYVAGTYEVSPTQNFDELLYTFVEKKTIGLTEVSVTIPEGYTVDDIINLLVNEKGIGTREGFVDAIQNGEYDYWFVKDLEGKTSPDRKYRLEGYLYPDTYYVYKESEETTIINKMLSNFHSKFNAEYKQECEKAGMTVDQVVNLASIIQMEAKYPTEYSTVSSVIHNRLKSSYYGYRLECDATIQYALAERKEDLTHEDTLIDSPYNSYKHGGLPPGPISNPTLKAIRAALYPEQTTYYFFVSDIEGHMLFAKTLSEHNANIAKVDAEAKAAGN